MTQCKIPLLGRIVILAVPINDPRQGEVDWQTFFCQHCIQSVLCWRLYVLMHCNATYSMYAVSWLSLSLNESSAPAFPCIASNFADASRALAPASQPVFHIIFLHVPQLRLVKKGSKWILHTYFKRAMHPGLWNRSPSNFGWLEPEPKTCKWWIRSRSLKFGFWSQRPSLWGKRVVQIIQWFSVFNRSNHAGAHGRNFVVKCGGQLGVKPI